MSLKVLASGQLIGLGLKRTRGGQHLLQIQLKGFRMDEHSDPLRSRLPVVSINDRAVRIPAIGVGVLALGTEVPEVLRIRVGSEALDVPSREVETTGEISAITENLKIGEREVEIYPLEIWGGKINAQTLVDNWRLIRAGGLPSIYTHMPYEQKSLGIATELLSTFDISKVLGYLYDHYLRCLGGDVRNYPTLYLGEQQTYPDVGKIDGHVKTEFIRRVLVRDVYLALVADLIASLRNGHLQNDFADRLMPGDVASNAECVFLTGGVLESPDINFAELVTFATDPREYNTILPPAIRAALASASGKTSRDVPSTQAIRDGYTLVCSPGIESWIIGGALYANSRRFSTNSEPIFAVAVEKEGLSHSVVRGNELVSEIRFDRFPPGFKLNSQLPPEADEAEKDIHRLTLIDCIANAIRNHTQAASSQIASIVALVVPGRVVELGDGQRIIIEGSDIPNWALKGESLVDEVKERSGFKGNVVLINDAVAAATHATSASLFYRGRKILVISLHDGVGGAVVHFLDKATFPGEPPSQLH